VVLLVDFLALSMAAVVLLVLLELLQWVVAAVVGVVQQVVYVLGLQQQQHAVKHL
jgi:hypothetical protein